MAPIRFGSPQHRGLGVGIDEVIQVGVKGLVMQPLEQPACGRAKVALVGGLGLRDLLPGLANRGQQLRRDAALVELV